MFKTGTMMINVCKKWLLALALTGAAFALHAQNVLHDTAVTTSSEHPTGRGTFAIDGKLDTAWNAGRHAPAWISIDMPDNHPPITRIRLIPSQSPNGPTKHYISAQRINGGWMSVASLSQYTADKQPIDVVLDKPLVDIKKIRVATNESPSWVAWYEIQAFAEADLSLQAKEETREAAVSEQGASSALTPSVGTSGVIFDQATGLIWAKCPHGVDLTSPRLGADCNSIQSAEKVTFFDAMRLAKNSRIGGYSDWRLPTMNEIAPQSAELRNTHGKYHCVVRPDEFPTNRAIAVNVGNPEPYRAFWTTTGTAREGLLFVAAVDMCDLRASAKSYSSLRPPVGYTKFGDASWVYERWNTPLRSPSDPIGARHLWNIPYDEKNMSSQPKNYVTFVRQGNIDQFTELLNSKLINQDREIVEHRDLQARLESSRAAIAEREQREYAARRAVDEASFRALLTTKNPRQMYQGAVRLNEQGETMKAKDVYSALVRIFPKSPEAGLARQRLAGLGTTRAPTGAASKGRSGDFEIFATKYEGGKHTTQARCLEGGWAVVWTTSELPNIWNYMGGEFYGAAAAAAFGIGLDTSLRRACIGNS